MKKIAAIFLIALFFSAVPAQAVSETVPFTAQAPSAKWSDQRQEDGCEEAAALMAMAWVRGETKINPQTAETEIIKISDFLQDKYGEFRDVYVTDVVAWIFQDYFDYDNVCLLPEATPEKIKKYLNEGHLVLAPTNGQTLKNPHFKAPGPVNHMLVIKNYDAAAQEFITNDPGTKFGENYRYSQDTLYQAIRAYPTGYHLPHPPVAEKTVIVVKKPKL